MREPFKRVMVLGTTLALVFFTVSAVVDGGAAAMDDKTFELAVTGDAGARVEGECRLEKADGVETFRLDETVPFKRRMVGRALRCELSSDSRIFVDASASGSRTRTGTSGGRVTINVR